MQADNGDVFKDREVDKIDNDVDRNEGECLRLLAEMHQWPYKLNEILDEADELHFQQKFVIMNQVAAKRKQLENDVKTLDEILKQIHGWGSVSRWQSEHNKLTDMYDQLQVLEERKYAILLEEK